MRSRTSLGSRRGEFLRGALMRIGEMKKAENMRYANIERLTYLLCQSEHDGFYDAAAELLCKSFRVGKRIVIDGERIVIKNRTYSCMDLKRVTINSEGSFAVYDRGGRKLCGWAELNLSAENIELFCIWVRKHGVPAEAVSGKGERILQWVIFSVILALVGLVRVLRIVM